MGHGRVARDRDRGDGLGREPGRLADTTDGLVQPVDDQPGQLVQAAGGVGVVDAGEDVGSDDPLGVVAAVLGKVRPGGEVDQPQRHPGGAQVDRQPGRDPFGVGGGDPGEGEAAAVREDRAAHPVAVLPQHPRQALQEIEVEVDLRAPQLAPQRGRQALGVGRVVAEARRGQRDRADPGPGRGRAHPGFSSPATIRFITSPAPPRIR